MHSYLSDWIWWTSYPQQSGYLSQSYAYVMNSPYMMTSSNGKIFPVTSPLWGNSPLTGEFTSQRPVTRSFNVFFDLHLNKLLSKPLRWRWFETPSRSLWRHHNDPLVYATKNTWKCSITHRDLNWLNTATLASEKNICHVSTMTTTPKMF